MYGIDYFKCFFLKSIYLYILFFWGMIRYEIFRIEFSHIAEIVLFHTNMHDQFLYLLAELINNNCLA
jgi:hypothetical protein